MGVRALGGYGDAMSLDDRLRSWQAAGLIDGATAERIRAHEAAQARPVVLWAIVGLGLLALALGVVLIVAAGWDAIPDAVKVGGHLALTAGVAAAGWVAWERGRTLGVEAALILLGALVLAGLRLQAEVFALTGEPSTLLALWLLLVAPAVYLLGTTRLTGVALALAAGWFAVQLGSDRADAGAQGLALAVPALLVAAGLWWKPERPHAEALRVTGLGMVLLGASLAHVAWGSAVPWEQAREVLERLPAPVLAVGLAIWLALRAAGGSDGASRTSPSDAPLPATVKALPHALAAGLIGAALALGTPHGDTLAARLAGVFAFAGMWAWVAHGALRAGWRGLFTLAVAAVAVRLLIVYFELFGSLAQTGAGLIVAGALVIGLALGVRRIVGRRP